VWLHTGGDDKFDKDCLLSSTCMEFVSMCVSTEDITRFVIKHSKTPDFVLKIMT
jgi:hypothetical protein